MTITGCREALGRSVPSDFDARSRLRKCFLQNLKEFQSALQSSLSNVIDLSATDLKTIEKLARMAATVWLEFATYRCRIIIRLKGPTHPLSMEARMALAQNDSLELTELPSLGRYGNVIGADMHSYTPINGCAGSSVILKA